MVSVTPSKATPSRFELLDTMRLLAAFMVVAYHWLFRGIQTGTITNLSYSGAADIASYGYLGVDLFFMISGFVITISAHGRAASHFAVRRLVRLYPAFWVAMLITAAVTAVWGAPVLHVTIPQVLANLTMAPSLLHQPLVDASYWTLLCELFFYAMIFVFLLVGAGKWLDVFFPAWAIGMVLIYVALPGLETKPLLGGLYAFFAAGAILSTIQRKGRHWWQIVGLAAAFNVAMRYVINDVTSINKLERPAPQSTAATIIIVCVFFAIMIIQTIPRVADWQIPQSRLLGALTYPVYLLHAYLGFMFFNQFANDSNRWIDYAIALVILVGLAYALHVIVESWPRTFWFTFFDTIAGKPLRRLERVIARPRQAAKAARSTSSP